MGAALQAKTDMGGIGSGTGNGSFVPLLHWNGCDNNFTSTGYSTQALSWDTARDTDNWAPGGDIAGGTIYADVKMEDFDIESDCDGGKDEDDYESIFLPVSARGTRCTSCGRRR